MLENDDTARTELHSKATRSRDRLADVNEPIGGLALLPPTCLELAAVANSLRGSSFALNIELVTGEHPDSKLELLLREVITMRQGIICNSQHRLSEVMWMRSIKR